MRTAVSRLAVAALISTSAFALGCAAAFADFTAPALVSASSTTQADYAYDPAISGDGRYVAYTGSFTSVPGVWRTDLNAGTVDQVAPGADTGAPSISDDGRYVSFTTDQDPVTGAQEQCFSVWVRDMDMPENAGGAYTLASSVDGGTASLTYSPAPPQPCGAAAASRGAMSADGMKIVFTTLSASDLAGGAQPTPAGQVAVRDLATNTTTLVSQTMASIGGTPEPVPGGAAVIVSPLGGTVPAIGPARLPQTASTATISADGGTVAWTGTRIPQQAPVQPAGAPDANLAAFNPGNAQQPYYYLEPLWRRIADGPDAPVRRVTGPDDPLAPGCPPSCGGPLALDWTPVPQGSGDAGPPTGIFISPGQSLALGASGFLDGLEQLTPRLSATGATTAFVSTAPDFNALPDFSQSGAPGSLATNLFVANMAGGLDRSQALTRLTNWASVNFTNTALTGPIKAIATSPDGSHLDFATSRISFPLTPPALVTPALTQAGHAQLYDVDLTAGKMSLVSLGFDGQPANSDVLSPDASHDGKTIVFASGAGNLVFGANNEGSNVFVVREVDPANTPAVQTISPLPAPAATTPAWRLSATTSRGPGGALMVDVAVPGRGKLTAAATALVSVASSAPHHAAEPSRRTPAGARARAVARASSSARHRTKSRPKPKSPPKVTLARRTVATASAAPASPGLVVLPLPPAKAYAAQARSTVGLYATITIRFAAPGHATLSTQLQASLLVPPAKSAKPAKPPTPATKSR
jgi:Tol biopolymer transport system component